MTESDMEMTGTDIEVTGLASLGEGKGKVRADAGYSGVKEQE